LAARFVSSAVPFAKVVPSQARIPDAGRVHDRVRRDDRDAARRFSRERDDRVLAVFPLAFREEDGAGAGAKATAKRDYFFTNNASDAVKPCR
jgi:hypothetical protein